MTIERKTEFGRFNVARNSVVELVFDMKLVEGNNTLQSVPHCTTITPGQDAKEHMAMLNKAYERDGFAKISKADIDRVIAIVKATHTKEIIAKYVNDEAATLAAKEAQYKAAGAGFK